MYLFGNLFKTVSKDRFQIAGNINKQKMGFTLAEVLITLVVIGIVAAITVPMLTNRLHEEYIERCKKTFSLLSQACNLALFENGPMDIWDTAAEDASVTDKNSHFVQTYVRPYLQVMKDCGYDSQDICEFKWKYLNSNEQHLIGNDWYKLVLNDGTILAYYVTVSSDISYALVMADVNGSRGPNKFGRDIFQFVYWMNYYSRTGKFEAYGMDWSRESLLQSGCGKNNMGNLCAALLMHDNWQMKEDYPW